MSRFSQKTCVTKAALIFITYTYTHSLCIYLSVIYPHVHLYIPYMQTTICPCRKSELHTSNSARPHCFLLSRLPVS